MPANQSNLLPTGSMVVFQEEDHLYSCDGQLMVSTTELIGSWFRKFDAEVVSIRCATRDFREEHFCSEMDSDSWIQQRAAKYRASWKETADRGTRIHAAIQRVINGEPWDTTPETRPYQEYANAIKHKLSEEYPEAEVYSELLLADPELGIAGTADLVIHIDDEWIIVDWKTGNEKTRGEFGLGICYDLTDTSETKYGLQTLCYSHLLRAGGYAKPHEKIKTKVIFVADDGERVNPRELTIHNPSLLQEHLNRMLFGV